MRGPKRRPQFQRADRTAFGRRPIPDAVRANGQHRVAERIVGIQSDRDAALRFRRRLTVLECYPARRGGRPNDEPAQPMRWREFWIEFHRTAQPGADAVPVLHVDAGSGTLPRFPGVEAVRPFAQNAQSFGVVQRGRDGARHRDRDVVLQYAKVCHCSIVTLSPNVSAALGFDQLGGYPDAVAEPPNAALQDVTDTEFPANLTNVDPAAFESETRVAGDDQQSMGPGKFRDQVLSHAVRDAVVSGIAG